MKKILSIGYYAILSAVLAVAITLVFSILPITGNIRVLTVLSGSMEPSIGTGSVVVIKQEASYEVGDIITFNTSDGEKVPTTHRITAAHTESGVRIYSTKGDANDANDADEVPEGGVIGKVWVSIPYLGYILEFVKKPVGFMLVIIVPSIIIVYEEIKKVAREIAIIRNRNAHSGQADE